AVTAEKAAAIIEVMGIKKAADIIEAVSAENAADIIEAVSTEKAVAIIARIGIEKAVAIIEAVSAEKAVAIIEAVAAEKAVAIIEAVSTEKAVAIIEAVSAEKAVVITEAVSTEKAATITAAISTEKAVNVIEAVAAEKATNIIEAVTVEKSVDVMEKLTTDKLSSLIPAMSETSLTRRLPELSTEKLYSIEPQVLFESLPNVPTEQLVREAPPEPPAEATAPIVIQATPREARYLATETWAGEWVVVVATPTPIDKLMIKTKRALKDIETIIEVFEKQPRGIAVALPAEQVVMAYFDISFKEIAPEDIALGHIAFKVAREWLEQNSAHQWSVVLNKYDPKLKRWTPLPTKKVKEDDSYLYYTAVITSFSKYAIFGSQLIPVTKFKATNLVIDSTEVETGQEVTIKTYVTNLSDAAGTYVATLWINSTVEAGQNIYLRAGETKPVSFTVTRDTEGSYEVRFDRLLGSFNVIRTIKPPLPVSPPAAAPAAAVKPGINWRLIGGVIGGVITVALLLFFLLRKRAA
ncbi:MAG: PGF-pre-PGF domain-containing protein, partial [Chloroflexi bacterium]|nr:PGF-pre-PGF domain-containing protein [Chloroflexota bacterium]